MTDIAEIYKCRFEEFLSNIMGVDKKNLRSLFGMFNLKYPGNENVTLLVLQIIEKSQEIDEEELESVLANAYYIISMHYIKSISGSSLTP